MIEVQLQDNEQPHPAIGHIIWWGRRAKFWDMDFIEDATDLQLDTLKQALDEFVNIMDDHFTDMGVRDLIKDYEICGSFAYGNQRIWSDFDIQLTTEDRDKQEQLRTIFLEDLSFFMEQVYKMQHRLKVSIEVRFGEWKNKQYSEVYSLRERKLYNREPHTRRPDTFKRRYNRDTRRYEEVEMLVAPTWDTIYWTQDGERTDAPA